MTHPLSRPIYWLFGTVFSLVLTLYTLTLAPGVVGGDAGEHQFVAPLLGIPHATGYPLYVLLGKLWTLLFPFGELAWRMNLFSALCGAAAAGMTSVVVYQLGQLLVRPHSDITPPPRSETALTVAKEEQPPLKQSHAGYSVPLFGCALIGGLTLAWGLTLWEWSIIAGVRSLNVLFFAVLTWQAIRWQQQRQTGAESAARRTLAWIAVTVGLSLAHHRTTLFYLPPLVAWIAWHEPILTLMKQPRRLLTLTGLTLAPLTLYGFTYWRGITDPPYSHERITDWQSFWFLVGASDSSGLFLHVDPQFLSDRLQFIGQAILAQLSWPGLLLMGVGGLSLAWRRTGHFLLQGSLVLSLLLFVLDFEVVNPTEAPTWYLMPAYFIFAVWSALGLLTLTQLRLKASPTGALIRLGLPLVYLALLSYTLALPNWQTLHQQATQPLDEWRQRLRGQQASRFVESSLPDVEPHSLLLGDWEQYTPMMYYRLIKGVRPDVEPRLPLDDWPSKVAAAHQQGRPVYFMRKTPDLIGTPHLSMVGALIHLQTTPQQSAPADITRLNANLEDELDLIGYTLRDTGEFLQVMLYWRARQDLTWDYALSLRLMDATGQVVQQRDATHPVLSSYPTSQWAVGEVVGDFYELSLRGESKPVRLWILPYRNEGNGAWHNLHLKGDDTESPGVMLPLP